MLSNRPYLEEQLQCARQSYMYLEVYLPYRTIYAYLVAKDHRDIYYANTNIMHNRYLPAKFYSLLSPYTQLPLKITQQFQGCHNFKLSQG